MSEPLGLGLEIDDPLQEIKRLRTELARRDEQLATAWRDGANAANLWVPGTPIPRNPYETNPTT